MKFVCTLLALLAISSRSDASEGFLKCDACRVALAGFEPVRKPVGKLIVDVAIPICEAKNGMGWCNQNSSAGKWACENVCKGMMPIEMNAIEELVAQSSPESVCALLKFCESNPTPTPPGSAGLRSNLSDTAGEKKWPNWPSNGGRLTGTFVHVTDLHLQLDYMEGANTDCGQPICCRKEAGMGPAGKQAQKFGDWACDLAPSLADSMFEAIGSLEVVPDFVINTGDDPAHDVWAQTKDANLAAINYVANAQLNMSFGRNRPIVNVFGNHEPVPVNQYRGPGHDDWLYSGAAQAWSEWLPEDAARTLKYGGFYQMRLTEKLRAVAMHSTMFMSSKIGGSGNWFFSVNQSDMAEQFPWLVDTLQQARANGEKVLLMHHCSKGGFDDGFGPMIMNITDAFSDVIVASLAGHSHTTWLSVLRDQATQSKPVDVTYVSGSGTPGGGNPTFRVFHYDLESYEITDYDQYWVDMDKANAEGKAVWVKDHSAKEYYGLKDLSGESWSAMATSMLHGNDNMTNWVRYARALTRGRVGGQRHAPDRKKEACTMLSVDKALLKQCLNDTTAEFDHDDDTDGSFVPIEMGQWLVSASESTHH